MFFRGAATERRTRDAARNSGWPRDFEESAGNVTVEDVAGSTPAGPDPEPYLEQLRAYEDTGFTRVYIHQIGDNQQEFADFAARELMPHF